MVAHTVTTGSLVPHKTPETKKEQFFNTYVDGGDLEHSAYNKNFADHELNLSQLVCESAAWETEGWYDAPDRTTNLPERRASYFWPKLRRAPRVLCGTTGKG